MSPGYISITLLASAVASAGASANDARGSVATTWTATDGSAATTATASDHAVSGDRSTSAAVGGAVSAAATANHLSKTSNLYSCS